MSTHQAPGDHRKRRRPERRLGRGSWLIGSLSVAFLIVGASAVWAEAAPSSDAVPPPVPGASAPEPSDEVGCPDPPTSLGEVLPEAASGAEALEQLGADLGAVAALNCLTRADLRRILLTDPTAWIDRGGRLFYVDAPPVPADASAPAAAGPFPYSQTFTLHSRPGAQRVIYLDFNGSTVSGTAWNVTLGVSSTFADAFDTNGNLTSFSNAEQDIIQSVWQRVAEDFAPFDVDVTTQDPGAAAIDRSSASDLNYGTRVVITSDLAIHDGLCANGCGGIAYVGNFDDSGTGTNAHAYRQPAFSFSPISTGSGPNGIANTVSHEAGHNLGLSHDGATTDDDEYYDGHGAWSPLMGSGYTKSISQWSKGEYANATNTEDDFVLIQSNGAPPVVDDHVESNPLSSQTPLVDGKAQGIIGTRADVDWFRFDVGCTGTTTIDTYAGAIGAYATNPSPNLDVRFFLYDGAQFIADVNPASGHDGADQPFGLSTTYSATLTAGTYYIGIDGVGAGDPLTTGYSDYGSVGRFAISATLPTCGTTQLLGNPGFENGSTAAPWVASSGVISNSTSRPARTGSWYAWLAGTGTSNTDDLYQQVTIPSGASATLTFWVRIDTAETSTTADDLLRVQVRNSSNTVLKALATYSNLHANPTYVQKSFDLSAYAGQTIRVFLRGVEDGAAQTSFVVDDFALTTG